MKTIFVISLILCGCQKPIGVTEQVSVSEADDELPTEETSELPVLFQLHYFSKTSDAPKQIIPLAGEQKFQLLGTRKQLALSKGIAVLKVLLPQTFTNKIRCQTQSLKGNLYRTPFRELPQQLETGFTTYTYTLNSENLGEQSLFATQNNHFRIRCLIEEEKPFEFNFHLTL